MDRNFLFVDLSYFVFYRYFALLTYYKMSKTELPEDVTNDHAFLSKFDDLFEKTIIKLIKQHCNVKRMTKNCQEKIRVVFGKDCCREQIWRNALTQGYKATRVCAPSFDGRIFEHVYSNLIPRLLAKYTYFFLIESKDAEADDVIAILCKHIHTKCSNATIVVITNDNDYLQLLDYVTSIYNLKGLDLSERTLRDCPSYYNMLLKVLVGDTSDNIKGVCGKQYAMNVIQDVKTNCLEQNEEACCEYVRNKLDPSLQTVFDLNKKLISFSCIPSEIQEDIKSTYDFILS